MAVMDPSPDVPALRLRGMRKAFGETRALDGVDIDVRRGEIHAIVGSNGSGKSTLIKVLAGFHTPDAGQLEMFGVQVDLPTRRPSTHGLAFVHQDLALIDGLSIVENLRVGKYETQLVGRLDWPRERERARTALAEFGSLLDPRLPVASLRAAERTMVALARAVLEVSEHGQDSLVVLDEPTASLAHDKVDLLLGSLRRLRASGRSVVMVSHRLDEVIEVADRVTVMRDGRSVGTWSAAQLDADAIVGHMLGPVRGALNATDRRRETEIRGSAWLKVRGLSGGRAEDVNLDVHRGELVGLTGLQGSGFEDVPPLVFGARPAERGVVSINGASVQATSTSPRRMIDAGVGYLPDDRRRSSAVPGMSVGHNVSVPVLRRFFARWHLDRRQEEAHVRRLLCQYDVKPAEPKSPISQLSGGNQQRALLGKWLQTAPEILMLSEPAQGVDVGAKVILWEQLHGAARAGVGLVIASVEYDELARHCHRIYVFHRGRCVAVARPDHHSDREILAAMHGADDTCMPLIDPTTAQHARSST